MNYSLIEQEAIVLNAAWGKIDDMVNDATFCLPAGTLRDTNLVPQADETLRLFNILLADFLSPLVARGKAGVPFRLPKPQKMQGRAPSHSCSTLRGSAQTRS